MRLKFRFTGPLPLKKTFGLNRGVVRIKGSISGWNQMHICLMRRIQPYVIRHLYFGRQQSNLIGSFRMDLSKQLDEITKLENELDSLISGSIDRSDLESVKRIEKLEEEQIKLKYQANILQRAILKEKIEAEQNDVLSDFSNVQTDKFVKKTGKEWLQEYNSQLEFLTHFYGY